jgi:hypothetical protein
MRDGSGNHGSARNPKPCQAFEPDHQLHAAVLRQTGYAFVAGGIFAKERDCGGRVEKFPRICRVGKVG